MAIIAKSGGGSYETAPAGAHVGVCVDVIDLGEIEVTYNGKTKRQHKIWVVWQIDEDRSDGKPHQVRKRYTLSLHEKSALRKDLESWRGKPFTAEQLDGFDVEQLLSVGCMLNVVHAPGKDGSHFANVAAIMRLRKGDATPTPRDYVRVCDREAQHELEGPPDYQDDWPGGGITDDDVPF
jgi:hypothetical protein